jgi:FMN phosphatase YigB (HAD superfamily)
MTIRCLLWDVGDTLCHERFLIDSTPAWQRSIDEYTADWQRWMVGELDTPAFAARLAPLLGSDVDATVAHMHACCRNVSWYAHSMAVFRERRLPQAIVTVNPDLFSETLVPHYGLHDLAGSIVTSWEERTEDKGVLCARALERLELSCDPSEALLIDNRRDNCEAWSARGGAAYLHTGDEVFARDVARGFEHLATQELHP